MADGCVQLSDELGTTLILRAWDDEAAVYDDISGDTHFLAERALRVLRILQQGPVALDDLLAQMDAGDHASPIRPSGMPPEFAVLEADQQIDAASIIDSLVEIGLIVRISA